MKRSAARQILQVSYSESHSSSSLSHKYSQLAASARDIEELILISAAYKKLQKDTNRFYQDLDIQLDIKSQIRNFFNVVRREYHSFSFGTWLDLKSEIEGKINQAHGTWGVRRAIKWSIPEKLQGAANRFCDYLENLDEKITIGDENSIKNVFFPLYKERRKRWIKNIYRDKIIILQGGLLLLTTVLSQVRMSVLFPGLLKFLDQNFPDFARTLEELPSLLSNSFRDIFWSIIGIVIIHIGKKYIRLRPERQFISPRFSNQGIKEFTTREAINVPFSKMDIVMIGFLIAIAILLLFSTKAGVVGAFVALLTAYLFARSFSNIREIKKKVINSLLGITKEGFNEVDDKVAQWIDDSEDVAYEAMMTCLKENCVKISNHLIKTKRAQEIKKAS